jgi:hypothetical protein
MEGLGLNPNYSTQCNGTFEGLSLMGQWNMDDMYACIAFEY